MTCAAAECRRQHHNKLNAEWRSANRERHRTQIREWRRVNAERVRAVNREWWDRNRAEQYEINRLWRAANRERHRELIREWEREHPAARAGYSAQRRGWRGAGRVSDRDWRRLVDRCNGRCYYCGSAEPLTVDHVVPLSRGGGHSIGNVVPACRSCNSSKQDKFLVEWRAGRCHGEGRKARKISRPLATRSRSGSKPTVSSRTVTELVKPTA